MQTINTTETDKVHTEISKQDTDTTSSSTPMDKEDEEDVLLALELMENAWTIMNDYLQTKTPSVTHASKPADPLCYTITPQWVQDQIPRILLGIGDALSYLKRFADAIDSYTLAAQQLEEVIEQEIQNNKKSTDGDVAKNSSSYSLDILSKKRKLAETFILIAEQLLTSPPGINLVTTESKVLLVSHSEKVPYAQNYYEKAKDELQNVVYIMGKLASEGHDLETEKEDICFLATMVMGVGMTLEEEKEFETRSVSTAKKIKR